MDEKTKPKKEKATGISNFVQHEDNPFIPNLVFPKGNKNVVIGSSNEALISKQSGEVRDGALFIGKRQTVDKEQFVKIFHSQLSAIFDLSKSALKMFSYIASQTDFGDKIIFNYKKCSEFTGYSSKETIYKGLAELIDAEIIARSTDHNVYFVNPQILYKGDRMVLITEYTKKKIDSIVDINQLDIFNNGKEI